jgi:hypothetical protein
VTVAAISRSLIDDTSVSATASAPHAVPTCRMLATH